MKAPYAIEVENLHQSFGNVHAVRGISFTVNHGEVVGFIGANGAGKTTTMRMMGTLTVPDAGRILIHGYDVVHYPFKVRELVGWMPDHFGAYKNMNVFEYLDFFARSYGLKGKNRKDRLDEVMSFTNLDTLTDRPCTKLSKGMNQRLCLGRTLLSDPSVLILDEPAAGLDPKARVEFKNLIHLLKEQGKTIFISSHILSELGEMCDNLLFINDGQVMHQGTSDSLKYRESAQIKVQVLVQGDALKLHQWISLKPNLTIDSELKEGVIISMNDGEANANETLHKLIHEMIQDGIPVYEFHRIQQNLEDAFIDILRTPGSTPQSKS